MFERRLKIFLFILLALGALVAARAAQVQIFEHHEWQNEAAATVVPPEFLQTTRGRILDCRGRVIAEDAPCSDICVAYPAILDQFDQKYEQKWLRETAIDRLHRTLGDDAHLTSARISAEMDRVRAQIDAMWPVLARIGGKSVDEIEQTRQAIIQDVEMRRRYLWHLNYELANQKAGETDSSWISRFLNGNPGEPIDQFDMVIAAQTEPHAIISNADNNTCTELAKHADEYPGLSVRKSTVRYYPYCDVAAHVIGRLSQVDREDLKTHVDIETNDLRRYWLNDDIGRSGLEALGEATLRGTRGKIIPASGEAGEKMIPAMPGRDFTATLDIELEKQIQELFHHVELTSAPGEPPFATTADMNGAAVLIDVPTGEVRAMVSNPTYDLNHFDEQYAALAQDVLRQPYLNRATQVALEPGSTVKPMVGIGAITSGVDSISATVACDGYLVLRGHKYLNIARCWIAKLHMPQHVIGLNLTFEDAIEQSCNVYFETQADRLGIERLAHFYSIFGLGRPTGVGIDETPGRIPSVNATPAAALESTTWFCGIGQTQVLATPIQMCNVAATVARNGMWMRPRLVPSENDPAIDLHLSAAALEAARAGMIRVVNTPTGTGREAHLDDLLIAGKTGTAQAAQFTIPRRDAAGNLLHDEAGHVVYDTIQPSTFTHKNPLAPWYWAWGPESKDFSHAWFIGFAPANHPRLAIAVMVEYGGHGGATAGRLAAKIFQTCADDGYLTPTPLTAER